MQQQLKGNAGLECGSLDDAIEYAKWTAAQKASSAGWGGRVSQHYDHSGSAYHKHNRNITTVRPVCK